MEKIDKKEFNKRIKEQKYFEEPKDHVEYRLPVVQYYLDNLANEKVIFNSNLVQLKGTKIEYKDDYFPYICSAFNYIVDKLKK